MKTYPIPSGEWTAQGILVVVKALLRHEVPASAVLGVVADLEAANEAECKQAELRRVEIEQMLATSFYKA